MQKYSNRDGVLKSCGFSVTEASVASSDEEWFNSTQPLKILPFFPPSEAMKFRKLHAKGWIKPGACNLYIGASVGDKLFGVLGFANPKYGNYDILLKADTSPSAYRYSTELLLYVLLSLEVKEIIFRKFNREINTAYSMCFSKNQTISRYRKFGELKTRREVRINNNVADKNLKVKARAFVNNALKAGKISKQQCALCGSVENIEAHHEDYLCPGKIMWLCIKCHDKMDGIHGTVYKIIGYNLGYIFNLGQWTLKEGKNRFIQRHGDRI